MRRLPLGLALLLFATPVAAKGPEAGEKVYGTLDLSDAELMVGVLRRHVAYVIAEVTPPPDQPLAETERTGFGVAIGPDEVATLAFNVEKARRVTIRGPSGSPLPGKVVLYDVKRRVAVVKTDAPLARAGLVAPRRMPPAERALDTEVFALVSTRAGSGVVQGVITEVGDDEAFEGHPRISLTLQAGMPVFDNRARLMGYSRVVAWDTDRHMIVPVEMIAAAKTATATPAKGEARGERPWWAR